MPSAPAPECEQVNSPGRQIKENCRATRRRLTRLPSPTTLAALAAAALGLNQWSLPIRKSGLLLAVARSAEDQRVRHSDLVALLRHWRSEVVSELESAP
jgi:hypothetical protein